MILERRVSRQVHKQAHFKQKIEEKTREVNGDSEMDKSNESTAGKCGADGDHEWKSPEDKKSHNEAGPPVAKALSKPEQTHTLVENSSPAVSPSAVKTSYNPITHVPSEFCSILTVVMFFFLCYLKKNVLTVMNLFFRWFSQTSPPPNWTATS